jgi:hypothetical protein
MLLIGNDSDKLRIDLAYFGGIKHALSREKAEQLKAIIS